MKKCFVSGIIGAFCMLFLILGYAAFDSIILAQRDTEQFAYGHPPNLTPFF